MKKNLSIEHVDFFMKCKNDPIFFAENAIQYLSINLGLSKVSLRNYQKNLLRTINTTDLTITNKSRQVGATMIQLMNIAHFVLFNTDKTVVIMANKFNNSKNLLSKVKDIIESLPEFLKPGYISCNKSVIHLNNGCKILAVPTTVDAFRGRTISYLYIDEAAYINQKLFVEIWKANAPVLLSNRFTKIHIESSTNGSNHFMKMYTDALCGYNDFTPIEIPYTVIDERNKNWCSSMIANIGKVSFESEFECKFNYNVNISNIIKGNN